MFSAEMSKINFPTQILLLSEKKSGPANLAEIANQFGFSSVTSVEANDVVTTINESSEPTILVIDCPDFKNTIEPIIRSVQINCSLMSVAMIACVKKQDISLVGPYLDAGYLDYMVTPLVKDDLACRLIFARERLFREHMYMITSERDQLTSILARPSFLDRARVLYASAVREQISVAIVMVSIDKLDEIANRYGKSVRESILVSFADILKNRKRDTDLICRYDDTTFCLMTVNMRESHLETYLDDLALACLSPDYNVDQPDLEVNASIGVSVNLGQNLGDMLKQCSLAVEKSRTKGKNQVSRYGESSDNIPLIAPTMH